MKLELAVLPLEVWADIFLSPWFTRQELVQLLNGTRNRNFANKLDKLLHDCGKPTLGRLNISSKLIKDNPNRQATLGVEGLLYCEFPQCDMPENIKGFKQLTIRHLDDQVLNFLAKIKALFTNVLLYMNPTTIQSSENVRILFGQLIPLLGSIRGLACSETRMYDLEWHFPGIMACANELHLKYVGLSFIPACLNWLSAPHNFDVDCPKFLKMETLTGTIPAIVEAVRKQFLAATTQSTFVIYLESIFRNNNRAEEFQLENAVTHERLTIRNAIFKKPNEYTIHYLEVLRHPMGDDAKIRDWIKERAYYEKAYNYGENENPYGEQEQLISITGPLTIGHISKNNKAEGMDQGEEDKHAGNAAGTSSSSAKKTCVIS